ncbi:hypothetical protein KO481_28525 [Nocardia sp. NEAU-G5]|uniref:Uncharacterized protein n=1 Tax=Nocardia albiluteola TaxID=2842303 RepID=A0ABS6B6U5_9NOCA|nr:hypothetical protein [Nocardia albiluteola]MBU3065461.1 hypothetical protein [Nocardia albiluteola]
MTDRIIVRGGPSGTLYLGPETAPVLGEGTAPLDTAVLEVHGGYLVWSVLAGQHFPAAVIDDLDAAQEWIWAMYGPQIALAAADFDSTPAEFAPEPGLPMLVERARKLGYAHWAARWWPASTLDDIPPLDERLVDIDIATLTTECDLLVDGADALDGHTDDDLATVPGLDRDESSVLSVDRDEGSVLGVDGDEGSVLGVDGDEGSVLGVDGDESSAPGVDRDESSAPGAHRNGRSAPGVDRAEAYALAAGPAADSAVKALVLARGSGGWDWRRCPPGIVDASERALSWEVRRHPGVTTIQISAVAAPHMPAAVPPHLRPRALVRTAAGIAATELTLAGDAWTGSVLAPDEWEFTLAVEIHVPGVGPSDTATPDDVRIRPRLREFARNRLRDARSAPDDTMLLAEIAAATTDTDF